MADDRLGYVDFLKAAWRFRPKVPGLGRMPLQGLGLWAFGVLGLLNPGFWLLGLALQLAFLFGLASQERFQKLVAAQRLQANQQGYESKILNAVARLTPTAQERYRKLLAQSRRVLGIAETLDEDQLLSVRDVRAGSLNQLLWIFLRLLATREVLMENLSRVDRRTLEAEIAKLKTRVEAEQAKAPDATTESALLRSLRGTLEIQQKRLDNFDRAQQNQQVIDAELERIEQQVMLIREETAVGGKAEVLSNRLDAVTGTLSETNRWMEQNAELFGSLGADSLGMAPTELPELPNLPPPLEQER